jgi:hypothetical protein
MTDERGNPMFRTNTCAACGEPLSASLARLGSIRCHDCRDIHAELADPQRAEAYPAARELARRESDGLEVLLLWYASEERVVVRVADARTGERFELRIDAANALDAFNHPFAYAPPPLRETDSADRALAYAEAA